jgi:hypothetical protein
MFVSLVVIICAEIFRRVAERRLEAPVPEA